MTLIRQVPRDPTDLVVQGEQIRGAAMARGVHAPTTPPALLPILNGALGANLIDQPIVVAGEMLYGVTFLGGEDTGGAAGYPIPPREILQNRDNGAMIRANACVAASNTGAIFPVYARECLINTFWQSTVRWAISGVTRDQFSNPLGNCRVIAFETGRLAVDGNVPRRGAGVSAVNPQDIVWGSQSPVVTQTISDGGGNYTVEVPMNVAYQLTGYKAGSPDVAGITRDDVTPTAIG